jgi:hypothetical protein
MTHKTQQRTIYIQDGNSDEKLASPHPNWIPREETPHPTFPQETILRQISPFKCLSAAVEKE